MPSPRDLRRLGFGLQSKVQCARQGRGCPAYPFFTGRPTGFLCARASWVWQSSRPPRCSSLLAHRNVHGDQWSPCAFRSACAQSRAERLWICQTVLATKWRRTSDVRGNVRAGRRHGPRVVVPCRHDPCASPDRLRASRYSFCVRVCIVSLSGKSQTSVSVCNVEMQCLLAKWLILSLVLSFATSLDRSCMCADRIT